MEQSYPTVRAVLPFDPYTDAQLLHKALSGFRTDEKTLINILCHRTSYQRNAIYQAYLSEYGKDLETKLKSELSGNFKKLMVALSLPKPVYMAREIYEAVHGLGTCEETLIEILCNVTNQEIHDMNAAYEKLYGHPMEKDIKEDTSGPFRMLLVSLAQGQRSDIQTVDSSRAKEDALRLYRAGEAKLGTDEKTFNNILTTRNWAHLRQVMIEYQSVSGHSLERAVESEFFADAEKGFLGILQCAENRPAYFAKQLHNAFRGIMTKDHNIIRIIVSRCDIDLNSIKRAYEKKFDTDLIFDISGLTSGDYKKALLALLG